MEYVNRKPWVAGILTLCLPGLGHFYIGEARRGIIIHIVILAITFPVFSLIWLIPYDYLNITIYLPLLFLIYFLVIRDAVAMARKAVKPYPLKVYNKTFVYILLVMLSSFVIRPIMKLPYKYFVVREYKLPTGSMKPTLLPGDNIITNRFIYTYNEPKRGDLIVFQSPNNKSIEFVKRVIALGGETLEIRDGNVYINEKQLNEKYTLHKPVNAYAMDANALKNINDFGPTNVPKGSYFVLGDNRANSFDSRNFGSIHKNLIRGKVISIYFSFDENLVKVRWERIGKVLAKECHNNLLVGTAGTRGFSF